MATNQYLVITDGTTTVSIADGSGGATSYRLLRGTWAPNVAGLRRSQLGGSGPYDDVVEEMQLIITGATAEIALTNVQTLHTLLEQADRWYRGEAVSTVLIKYSPRGATTSSAAAPLQAVILGRAEGDDSAMSLPDIFEDVGLFLYVANVTIRFRRRGMWLHTVSAFDSASTPNGSVAVINMTSTLIYPSPTRIEVTNLGINGPSVAFYSSAYFLCANSASSISAVAAKDAAGGAYTSVSGTATNAINANVLRYTPTVITEVESAAITIFVSAKRLAVLFNAKNNSATTSFSVRYKLVTGGSSNSIYTRQIVIGANTGPSWYMAGIVSTGTAFATMTINIKASAASDSVDIDSIYLFDLDNSANSILAITNPSGTITTLNKLVVNHAAGTLLNPLVTLSAAASYQGDPFFSTNAGSVYALLLQSGGGTTTNYWRASQSGTVINNVITAERTIGYLVPR